MTTPPETDIIPPAGGEKLPPVKAIQKTAFWQELVTATRYLTRLRIPLRRLPDSYLVGRSLAWFPLIGALIGAFGATIQYVLGEAGLPSVVTATLAVAGMMWLTRALHEEELANFVNHYGETGDKARRVDWIREERALPYGTITVILLIILKVSAIENLATSNWVFITLIIAGAWSRAAMVMAAAWLKPQAGDPVADYFGQAAVNRVIWAVLIALLAAFAFLREDAGFVMATTALAAILTIAIGSRLHKGYYNGRLLGGIQQIVEITVLCATLTSQYNVNSESTDVGSP